MSAKARQEGLGQREVSPVLGVVLGILVFLIIGGGFWLYQEHQRKEVSKRENRAAGIRRALQDPKNQSRLREIMQRNGSQ